MTTGRRTSSSSPAPGYKSLALLVALLLCQFPLSTCAQPAHAEEIDRAIAQLTSDDWKTRQRATQTLIRLADDALPRLERLVTAAGADDEVRTRAAAAIAQIEEDKLTGTSLVTLRLADVPAPQAFAQLARHARASLPAEPPALWLDKSLPRVSLDVDHAPFWQAMQALCEKTGLEPTPITRHNRELGLGVTRGDADWMDKPIALAGPLLIRADRLTRTSTLQLRPAGDVAREFNISLTVFAEPKLRVLDYSGTLTLLEALDELGNSLVPPPDDNGGPGAANVEVFGNQRDGNTSRWEVGATLHYPKAAGKRITRLRATTALQVQTRSASLDVPIAGAKNLTRTLDGGLRVTVKSLDASRCELAVHRDGRSDAQWYAVRTQLYAGQAQLLDDKGQIVARNQNSLDTDESNDGQRMDLKIRFAREPNTPAAGAEDNNNKDTPRDAKKRNPTEATRLVWEFPTEIRQLTIPFELHDLDIP
jgi:hypothetical protein